MATPSDIWWRTDSLDVCFKFNAEGHVSLDTISVAGSQNSPNPKLRTSSATIAEVRISGEESTYPSGKRQIGTHIGSRLIYQSHKTWRNENINILEIVTKDPKTQLSITNRFTCYDGVAVIRSTVTVRNTSKEKVALQTLNSLTFGGLTMQSKDWWDDYRLHVPYNTWFREAMWQSYTLPEVGVDEAGLAELGAQSSFANYVVSNNGSFSTAGHLPMGALTRNDGNETWMWQIEHNGSWRWEIGDWYDSLYLSASGPVASDHLWSKNLEVGESFTSVPVSLCKVEGDLENAFQTMNHYRRNIRRPHQDYERLPVIFNDYMNCLMGDPTEEKVAALIPAAQRVGAEYFVIDCGWYADSNDWWDSVGEWLPSKVRFPSGFDKMVQKIRNAGMVPGLWLEPEVIGVNSPILPQLPDDAFFRRNSKRVLIKERFQLDYRCDAVRRRMTSVIGHLVRTFGIGYFKFDYNIDVVQGTDIKCDSPGQGLLEHNQAYLGWVRELLDTHQSLVIESCSSGAQRMDYAMLSVHTIQSTSDQQDPVRYAAISAALPTAVTPEQSASWSYPQQEWDDEMNTFTMINSMLGRMYLSGPLHRLSEQQLSLVEEGVSTYKAMRDNLIHGQPLWPIGLPKWREKWVALGIACASGHVYIAVWRRGGGTDLELPIKGSKGKDMTVRCLYPKASERVASFDSERGSLLVTLPTAPSARLFEMQCS